MGKERMAHLPAEGPPPMPGDLAWAPETTILSARCPICGRLCDVVYLDRDYLVLGCDQCVVAAYVHDYIVELAEKEVANNEPTH